MNCWKTINFHKEFGLTRIYSISLLVGLVAFIFLYVPLSIVHGTPNMNKNGIIPFGLLLILLPGIHSFMHILPLIITNKRAKMNEKAKKFALPSLTYYPASRLSKQLSVLVALAPTFFLTLPGIIASYVLIDYDVYILLITAFHIGISFTDFLYIIHLTKAPKQAVIENENGGFAILIKAQE
ncbi:DUF3267 domain-containing protein [Lentibacillus sp. N15]|uniref:DUF3267 domain-containing protein n=1 Tax=Lentibacillus songyuanensis TaxID=3136161 RepID=UPI0031B9BC7B